MRTQRAPVNFTQIVALRRFDVRHCDRAGDDRAPSFSHIAYPAVVQERGLPLRNRRGRAGSTWRCNFRLRFLEIVANGSQGETEEQRRVSAR